MRYVAELPRSLLRALCTESASSALPAEDENIRNPATFSTFKKELARSSIFAAAFASPSEAVPFPASKSIDISETTILPDTQRSDGAPYESNARTCIVCSPAESRMDVDTCCDGGRAMICPSSDTLSTPYSYVNGRSTSDHPKHETVNSCSSAWPSSGSTLQDPPRKGGSLITKRISARPTDTPDLILRLITYWDPG